MGNKQTLQCLLLVFTIVTATFNEIYGGVDIDMVETCTSFHNPQEGNVQLRVPVDKDSDDYKGYRAQGTFAGTYMMADKSRLPLTYFTIPNAGSTSIRQLMHDNYAVPWEMHHQVSLPDHVFPSTVAAPLIRERKSFVFTFVAEPISHFVEGFLQVNGGRSVSNFQKYVKELMQPHQSGYKMSNAENGCANCNEYHFSQMNVLRYGMLDENGFRIPFNFIGRMTQEHIAQDLVAMEKAIRAFATKSSWSLPPNWTLGELAHKRSKFQEKYNRKIRKMLLDEPEYMRRICWLRFQDFTCFGFSLPKACQDVNGNYNVTEFGPPILD